jgi:hypothetical protein
MGEHLNAEGEFQSDKYPTCPAGKFPISTKDPLGQDLLWEYALRTEDEELGQDLKAAILNHTGGKVPSPLRWSKDVWNRAIQECLRVVNIDLEAYKVVRTNIEALLKPFS